MEAIPNLVEKDLAPPGFETRRSALFGLQGDKLFFDVIRALSALQKMSMDVLARGICR